MGKTMSMQELATHLGLNPGTVFRNLNSLTNAKLLTKEIRGDQYYYRTNFPFIQAIFQHVLDFYQKGGPDSPGLSSFLNHSPPVVGIANSPNMGEKCKMFLLGGHVGPPLRRMRKRGRNSLTYFVI